MSELTEEAVGTFLRESLASGRVTACQFREVVDAAQMMVVDLAQGIAGQAVASEA